MNLFVLDNTNTDYNPIHTSERNPLINIITIISMAKIKNKSNVDYLQQQQQQQV